jgi:uroporphyrinogen decarboxylase
MRHAEMTGKERIRKAVLFQKTDCIPSGPYMANHCSVLMGYRLKDCYTNAKNLAEAQYKAWEFYGQDIITVQSDNYYIPEGFGCHIRMPDCGNHTPSMEKPVLENLSDVDRLPRLDPKKDGRMHIYLDAMRILRLKTGESPCLRACGVGPFTLASHLRGTEAFLFDAMDVLMEGDAVKEKHLLELIQLCTDTLVDFALEMLEAGADIIQCADSLASLDMISPAMYEKFAYPFEKQFFERTKEACRKHDAYRLLHICGRNQGLYDYFKTLDTDLIEIDSKVDLAFARKQLGEKHIAIIGNLDPVTLIWQGNPERIREEAQKAIKDAGQTGFILGSGCEVPIAAPSENIRAILQTARDYRFKDDPQ